MKALRLALFAIALSSPALALTDADLPTRFPIPWANDVSTPYIRPIPEASQIGITPGAASLQTGFPPLNFTPTAAGGIPPFGADFNGIFNQITLWSRWQAAGGPTFYNGSFSTSISGYPKAAILWSTTLGDVWLNLAESNTVDPDGAGTNWSRVDLRDYYAVDSGTTNALVATFTPAPATLASLTGKVLRVKVANTTTSATPTITINGFSSLTIINPDTSALRIGQLRVGMEALFVSDGTNAQLVSVGTTPSGPSRTTISTAGSGTYTPPSGAVRIFVRYCAGGGGGGGGGPSGSNQGAGVAGGNSSFNSITTAGGKGGSPNSSTAGAGGAVSGSGSGTAQLRVQGAAGANGDGVDPQSQGYGGSGGPSFFGGGGNHIRGAQAGAASVVPCAGGSGGAHTGTPGSGGGGAGEYAELIVNSLAASYAYTVGAAGTAGTAGVGGVIGGAGAAGIIVVDEYYN